ncbi:MAG TPA: galactosylceramidase [Rugosimonospora sp.]|nr:galactosylceramidase [Rugosimonospora sp.]
MRLRRVLLVLATAATAAGVLVAPVVAGHLLRGSTSATNIVVDANGAGRTFDGVGAVLGGGGNARYLMDYPEPERSRILDYLFTPGVGASLQLMKLEIGGDANSTDGAEPSIEHVRGRVDCDAGYEFAIAAQAVARNPALRLYGLQWTAPSWVSDGTGTLFTADDIRYLLDWLGCARKHQLTVDYLGGWNESDNGHHATWFHDLRTALDAHGYRRVLIVAGDALPHWEYADSPDVAILGTHDVCGFPTGIQGAETACTVTDAARDSGKPLWGSELGAMDAGAQSGCHDPCAPAMDRAVLRGYIDARLTGFLEWPVLDAMPAGLPFENRGLVTADQPWSGNYSVNAMTWAIAHLTQFAQPGWRFIDSASGYLGGERENGSYVTLVSPSRNEFSTVIETTAGVTAAQRIRIRVTGGTHGLDNRPVYVWASDFRPDGPGPGGWFIRRSTVHPVHGAFSLTVQPGWVYSLTTTTGQGRGDTAGDVVPAAGPLSLPYLDSLGSSGPAGGYDDEPGLLAAQDGAFEVGRCAVPDKGATACTLQHATPVPVLWPGRTRGIRYPYATLGDPSWTNYSVSVDTLLTQAGTASGVIGRFSARGPESGIGRFNGYLFDVSSTGAWRLIRNSRNPAGYAVLAAGRLASPPGVNQWHRLTLTLSGDAITGAVDGRRVATVHDNHWVQGQAGIEAGAYTATWPQAQYANLSVTP